jgi:hypothetical protein
MNFGCVDFPNELVESRAARNLVVFAGAGVSMPAPSNLPDFKKLAIGLAQGTKALEKGEPLDRFLGRLDKDLRIYDRARERLLRPDSKPNALHFSLLKLFGDGSAVRLVTTNFDSHFSVAAADTWESEGPEIFAAPALPVGGDFLGIVHLHGSAARDPKRMVLTDADFGRAYLTEGWARRFLQEMFLQYVVLFVGYSHNDPVMQYLARGLPNSTVGKRFALVAEGNDRFWNHLGIVPLAYPKRRGRNSHREQGLALAKWVTFTAERPLDKRERIRRILSNLPPGAGEDHDYLVDALSDVRTTRFFTEFATIEWFEWLQGRDRFLRLFRRVGDLNETDEPLAWWFAEWFTGEHSGRALEWIARNGLTLGPVCWFAVAQGIFRQVSTNGCRGLDKWVPLLIRMRPERAGDLLELILSKCRYPTDATVALLLFQHLLGPALESRPNRCARILDASSEPDVELDLRTVGGGYWARDSWLRYFLPNLEQFAGPLVSIVAAHLEEMASLSKAHAGSWDFVSIRLPDLSTGSLLRDQSGLGLLVEVARETLRWLIQNSRKRADGLIETWWNAGSIVLRRLAVFGVAHSSGWPPDDKLRWLLERDLLYKVGIGREVSAVLKEAFRDASPEMKDRVVDATLTVPIHAGEYRDDWMRGILWTLKTTDPDYARVLEELSKLPPLEEHVREPEPAPPASDDLLAVPPADQVNQLLAYESKHADRRDHGGLSTAVQRAVADKPDWGFELATALRERAEWETVLWRSVVAGWNQDGLGPDQWTRVLNFLIDTPQAISRALDEIVELLDRRTSADSNPFQGPLLAAAVGTGLRVWRVLETREHEGDAEAKDWLFLAINHAGGRLAQFFLQALWQSRRDAGDTWRGLTDDFRLYLESVVRGASWEAEMARVVIASAVQTLFVLDAAWTKDNMFQLFDWSADPRRAQQAWHGYLTWGKWNNNLLEYILPCFRGTFAKIEENLGADHIERFCEVLAGIALYGAVEPMESGWLREFTRLAGLKARREWISAVGRILREFPAGKRQEVWARWMRNYWQFRLEAVPVLDSEEVRRMVDWSTELEGAFPEAVTLILKGPAPEGRDMMEPCLRLRESGLWRTYPQESALLLRWLAQSESRLWFGDCIVDIVKELAPLGAETAVLVDVCQRLAELGYAGAEDLKRYVESQGGGPSS